MHAGSLRTFCSKKKKIQKKKKESEYFNSVNTPQLALTASWASFSLL